MYIVYVCVYIWWGGKERILYIFFFPHFFKFNWSIVDLQGCDNFCCTTKWFSYTCTHIRSLSDSFPTQIITEYWVEFPVLYNRSPFGHSFHIPQYAYAHPKPPVHPSPLPVPFGNHKFFKVYESFSLLQISSFVSLRFFEKNFLQYIKRFLILNRPCFKNSWDF